MTKKKDELKAGVRLAIEAGGGARKLAFSLGLRHQAVYQWVRIPIEQLLKIEQITGVPRDKLRPDLYQGYVRKLSAHERRPMA